MIVPRSDQTVVTLWGDLPYETYRRLRDEQPSYWNPDLRFWVLGRFEDVLEDFRDTDT